MLLTLLFTTFVTVFLAEMGDKTQLTTITLSSTTNKPLAVFIGSSIALILATLLGALAGGSIANLVPAFLLKLLSGTVFLIIGINLLLQSRKESKNDSKCNLAYGMDMDGSGKLYKIASNKVREKNFVYNIK